MLQNPLAAVLPPDQADLVLIMVIIIPISYLLSLIYNKYLFLAITMATTIGFQSILFPHDKWVLWIQQQVAYFLVIFAPRKYVGHIVIVECFIALIFLHLKRVWNYYGENPFDITGIFMMQLFNYIGLAYNYQNGARDESQLTPEQIQRRVVQKPSYVTYLGYVNFLPASLVGPVYEFTDFQHYLDRSGDYKIIPNTLPAVVRQGGIFIFALALYQASSIFPLFRMLQPVYAQYSLPYKLLYSVLAITHIELKYVVAWSLGMMGMRASGFTYNPSKNVKDDKGDVVQYDFGRVEVNNMTSFYLKPSFKDKVDAWNISVQWALKRYIYENIYDPRKCKDEKQKKKLQMKAQLATVTVSALWHGLYPGYFFSFLNWVLFIQIANQLYRLKKVKGTIVAKLWQKSPMIYNLVENCFATFVMTYFGVAFHLMTWDRFLVFFYETRALPYLTLWIGYFLIMNLGVLGKVPRASKDKKDEPIKTD